MEFHYFLKSQMKFHYFLKYLTGFHYFLKFAMEFHFFEDSDGVSLFFSRFWWSFIIFFQDSDGFSLFFEDSDGFSLFFSRFWWSFIVFRSIRCGFTTLSPVFVVWGRHHQVSRQGAAVVEVPVVLRQHVNIVENKTVEGAFVGGLHETHVQKLCSVEQFGSWGKINLL